MKVLLITDGIFPFVIGGMQKHSYYLTKYLAAAGHEITLVHCTTEGNRLPLQAEVLAALDVTTQNVEVIGIPFPKASWYPGHYVKESYIYSKIIFDLLKSRLSQFDFIYAKGFTAWYFLNKKSSIKNMPPIGIKFHGYEMFQPPANLKMRLHNYLLKGPVKWNNEHADYIFSYGGKISEIIKSIGISEKTIIEIPTGIESSWCRQQIVPQSTKEVHFVFVGRYERRKGIEELLVALNAIMDLAFHFHFIGPIPATRRIKSDKIEYHGSVTDTVEMKKILDGCQVMVVPSHSEGMPNVIMEGMARGLAIAATDVGAVSAAVDANNGWLLLPGDALNLEQTLRQILALSKESLEIKRRSSLEKIRHFSWENIAAKTAAEIARKLA